MIYFLLILLVAMLIAFYYLCGKVLLSPSVMATASFVVAVFVYILGYDFYGSDIHGITVVCIVSFLLVGFIGEYVAKNVGLRSVSQIDDKQRTFGKKSVIVATLFVFAISTYYFYDMYQYSLILGNEEYDFISMVSIVRKEDLANMSYHGIDSRLFGHMSIFSVVLVYYFTFAYFKTGDKVCRKYYLLPIIAYFPTLLANNGRTLMMLMFLYVALFWYVAKLDSMHWIRTNNCRIVGIVIFLFVCMLFSFCLLGYRRTGHYSVNVLVQYISSGIYGLDYFLLHGEPDNIVPLQRFFSSIYMTLRRWGFDIPLYANHGLFYSFACGSSNIYTAFKTCIKDLGYCVGLMFIFLFCFFTRCIINKLRSCGWLHFVYCVLLGRILFFIVLWPIDFYLNVLLSTGTIWMIFYAMLFQLVLRKKFKVVWKDK